MKSKILKRLAVKKEVVSGEKLSKELGISRVSIWKHIRGLQEMGYNIISTPKGYMLEKSPDRLFPWEFPAREEKIHYFPEVSSTMDIARDMARKGCPDFTVVIAGRQIKGRGRLQRTWLSDEGGIYFTIVVRPKIPPVLSSRVNFIASSTLARVLCRMFNIDAKVKWPNDILVNGKKITGMLSEMEVDADMVSFVNIGMGINVNNDPMPHEPNAVSLKILLGHEVSRTDILSAFLDDFEDRMNHVDYERVVEEWKKDSMTLDRHVKIVTANDTYEGLAVDVDKDGALILELADGTKKKVIYGDCFIQKHQ